MFRNDQRISHALEREGEQRKLRAVVRRTDRIGDARRGAADFETQHSAKEPHALNRCGVLLVLLLPRRLIAELGEGPVEPHISSNSVR